MSPVASGAAESFSCWVELVNGETAEAERLARRSYETLDRQGERSNWQMAACYLARALCNQGRYQEAAELTEATKSMANTNGNVWGIMNWLGVQAKIVAAQGDVEQGERLALQAVTVAERTDAIDVYAESLLDLAEVLRTADRSDEAKPLIERALELWEGWGAALAAARTRAILGELGDGSAP
jgi:tetratricopeptide (TPR) repeat protein